jgi:spore coat polysaccharide biosynthesis protein SpsF (cytidylyltransferase family)
MKYLYENTSGFGIIIQARIGSTRLPNKMVLPFYKGLTVFDIILEKIQSNFPNVSVVLATSKTIENELLVEKAKLKGCRVFQGEENNVLKRFSDAAKENGITKIIRICADNPFLDVKELRRLIDYAENNSSDYISFQIDDIPSIKTHFGFWTEYVTLDALEKVKSLTDDPFFQEHVTNFIYNNPSLFEIEFIKPCSIIQNQKDIRMTLDTEKDFKTLAEIYSILHLEHGLNFGLDEILNLLSKNNKYKEEMALEISRNIK